MVRGLLALARSTHPLPTVGVTLIATILAVTSGLEPGRVALVATAILTNQISIGLSNDALDAARDRAAARQDKPVAAGVVDPRRAMIVAIISAATSLVIGVALHPLAGAANAVFIVSGWAYNLGLKATVASALPYATGFAALPAVVALSATPPMMPSGWVIGAGALLGVGAHFANVLPDIEDDRSAGVLGLPQRLGFTTSAIVVAVCLASASLCLVGALSWSAPWSLLIVGLSLVLGVACAIIALIRPGGRAVFTMMIIASLLAATLLAVSGSALGSR